MTRINYDADRFIKDVQISRDDPDAGMIDNAALLAFYGSQQGLWEGQVHYIKMVLETQEARVEAELRKDGDKITVAAVAARVALDEEVQKLKKSLAVAKMQDTLYNNSCKALADRGNNIRSLGTWLRSERANIGTYSVDAETTRTYTREERADLAKRLAKP
jgi:hypothetical protein